MRTRLLILCSAMMVAQTTHAGIITGSAFANSGYIPDGSAVGSSATAAVSGYLPSISSISVNLNISGGYNGDLYAYLSYGGVLVPLLNRVGVGTGGTRTAFGYSDAGMNIALSDSGANNIHFYQEVGGYSITGGATWRPDGRAIDPLLGASSFNADGTTTFGSFNGMNPNGTWTLFFADLSAGEQSRVLGWSLDITAVVPEPANVALGVFAGVFLVFSLARSRQVRNQFRQWRVATARWLDAV